MDMEHHATFSLNAEYHLSYRRNFEAFYKGTRSRWSGIGSIVRRISATHLVSQIPEPDYQPSPDPSRPASLDLCEYECPHPYNDAQKREKLMERLESGQPTDIPELIKLIPTNSSDHAIEIMADVRAYWQGTLLCALQFVLAHPFFRRQWRSNVALTIFF